MHPDRAPDSRAASTNGPSLPCGGNPPHAHSALGMQALYNSPVPHMPRPEPHPTAHSSLLPTGECAHPLKPTVLGPLEKHTLQIHKHAT
jgi:hypothetical protein